MKKFIHQCILKLFGALLPQFLLNYFFNLFLNLRGYNNYYNFKSSGENYFICNILKKHNPEMSIDIGSNIGSFTKEILQNTESKVISFEPLKKSYSELRALGDIWGDRLLVINKALGAKESVKTIHFNENKSSHASLIPEINDLSYVSNHKKEKIVLTTLDIFLKENPQDESIDYIKIDTEGYEYEVLIGCKETINLKKPKFIHIEFNWHQLIKSQTLYSFSLLLKGYDVYQMLPNSIVKRDPLDPISNLYFYSNFVFVREDISL